MFRSKPRQELQLPESLRSEAAIPALTKAIMMDEETADFTISCETKSFKVHKTFLCSRLVQTSKHFDDLIVFHCRSPVLRAMILGKMKEAQKSEVFIE